MFTLFAPAFFLIGLALFGIGLLGEYIGRIYQEVRARPRYVINARAGGAGAEASRSAAMRAVVFAYHDVGVRCLRVLLAHGVEVPLVVTHARRRRREHLVRQRGDTAAEHGMRW